MHTEAGMTVAFLKRGRWLAFICVTSQIIELQPKQLDGGTAGNNTTMVNVTMCTHVGRVVIHHQDLEVLAKIAKSCR